MLKKYLTVLVLGIILLTHLSLFFFEYAYGENFPLKTLLALFMIISLLAWIRLIWIKQRLNIIVKVLCLIGIFVSNVVIGLILLILSGFIPGSMQHEYIMWNFCFPAMEKYYGVDELYKIPGEPGKWFYQHSECEQNVRKGKGAVWSENPPGFVP